ncbi:MAG TPA: nucleotidyltransferase domain-containing protein [Proteobacteria bacterium]|nr:nucleotidyltransferase domain-containing protein [Pseudomonadota bacterium]
MYKALTEIAERFDCILIYLFGSQADMGRRCLEGEDVTPDAFSDLDVAVTFREPPNRAIEIYGDIYKEISKIFEPFTIDLVFMHEVSPLFQYEIIKGARIYREDEQLADEFEENVMKQAEDLLFKKRIFDHEVMEAIEDGYIEFEYSPNP